MPETSAPTPVLEMVDVTVASTHEDRIEIEGIHWTARAGDYWVVGGLPGSGKSDLLSTAAGLLRPMKGTCRLFGRDRRHLSEEEMGKERLRVGLVFGNEGRLFTHLTVSENLSLPICYHFNCSPEEAEEKVRTVLKFTGLTGLAHNTPGNITRNLRPRVALARSLALGPELLLLDNPLRTLDPREVRWWLGFLRRLNQGHEMPHGRPVTLLVATDDLRPWEAHGRQFALIKEKQWVHLGGPAELKQRQDPWLRELLTEDFIEL